MSVIKLVNRIIMAGREWVRRNLRKAAVIFVVIIVLMLISKLPKRSRQADPIEVVPLNVAVMTVTAEPNLHDSFDLPAAVEPNRIVTVSAEVAGRIELLPLKKGSEVPAGQLLVQLNTDLLRPGYEIAKAQVERDKIEFERMESLVKEAATSRRDLDDATTKLLISKAMLDEIGAKMERTSIVAPMAGQLNDLFVEEGEYVQPDKPVAQMVDIDTVKVVVEVPESDIAFFSKGQNAVVLFDLMKQQMSQKGKITYISELANPQTRTTRIEVTLNNTKRLLRSGQLVKVRLTRRILNDAIMIPLQAVIPMEDTKVVYVVNSSQAQRRPVQIGFIKGDRVQVASGLKAGDKLIIAGHRFVAPGQKVKIISGN